MAQTAKATLIFPKIIKAGLIIGAQSGDGVLRINNRTVGYYNLSAASFGLQAGAQEFSYALFFMTDSSLSYLQKSDGWAIGSGPSVVVIDQSAAASLTTALDKYRRLGARNDEAKALNAMGSLLLSRSTSADALPCYEQALALAASISSPTQEAGAREGIGRCHLQDGRPGPGITSLRQALAIYQHVGSPNAEHVQKTLTSLPARDPDPAHPGPPNPPPNPSPRRDGGHAGQT